MQVGTHWCFRFLILVYFFSQNNYISYHSSSFYQVLVRSNDPKKDVTWIPICTSYKGPGKGWFVVHRSCWPSPSPTSLHVRYGSRTRVLLASARVKIGPHSFKLWIDYLVFNGGSTTKLWANYQETRERERCTRVRGQSQVLHLGYPCWSRNRTCQTNTATPPKKMKSYTVLHFPFFSQLNYALCMQCMHA